MSDPSTTAGELLFEEAYKRLLPEYESLNSDELVGINLDIPKTVSTVLGAGSRLSALTARIAEEMPEFDVELITKLDTYAMALSHAHTLYALASDGADALQPLIAEGRKLRTMLLADARALALRGHLHAGCMKELRGSKGYQSLAFDLQLLAAWLRGAFPQIAGQSGVQAGDLVRAEGVAAGIVRAIGLREQGNAALRSAADVRVRAFTLLTRAYDQTRRAVTYLRWEEGDVERIVPSLYAGRGGRKREGRTSSARAGVEAN
jgi:hypothetical protein